MSRPNTYLRKVDAKCIHVETVQEASKRLAKAGKALVHDLEVHHVDFQIGHGVRKFREGRLECVQGEWGIAIAGAPSRVAKRGAR